MQPDILVHVELSFFIAHEILSDPDKRREYDNRRKYGGSYQPYTSFNFQNFNFDDLFGDFDDFENFQGHQGSFGGNQFKIFSEFPDFSNLVSSNIYGEMKFFLQSVSITFSFPLS